MTTHGLPSTEKLTSLRLLVFDFDGVFTDNSVLVDSNGIESVRCWRSDGLGIARLRALGLEMLVLSTEMNEVVARRCEKLRLRCEHGVEGKCARLYQIAINQGIDLERIAFVGNDTNDLDCLKMVGLPVCVADADPRVVPFCQWVTKRRGGYGAVREVADAIADAIASKQYIK
ncbi:MAG: HAD hydrolase family protein [Verrucomicrobiia bacterium]